MATALTVYLTSTNDTLLTTARQLVTAAPTSETSVTNKIGKSTGWDLLASQGSGNTWAGGASEPAPAGGGFILDTTTLDGQDLLAGTFSPKAKFKVSVGSISAEIRCRLYKYNAGVYTLIGEWALAAAGTGTTISTTATAFTFGTVISAATQTALVSGDKLYVDYPTRLITNSTGSNTATISSYENGGASEEVITAGYQTSVVLDQLAGSAGGVATASPAISLIHLLQGSASGVATATAALTVQVIDALTGSAAGRAIISGALAVTKALGASGAGRSAASLGIHLSKLLGGGASGSSTASSGFSLTKLLGAAAHGAATVGATLGGAALDALSGSAAGRAVVSGGLSVAHVLQGAAHGVASAVASLGLVKPLGASGAGVASAGGGLSLRKLLGAAAHGVTTIAGALSVTAGGVLEQLAGAATGLAHAIGLLSDPGHVPELDIPIALDRNPGSAITLDRDDTTVDMRED